jgi:hypothetical protein
MNTLTQHLQLERDPAPRMSDDVPADGTFLVIDGSPADAEEYGDRLVVCTCDDGMCAKRDRHEDRMFRLDDRRYAEQRAAVHHGHVVPVRLYVVVGEVAA